MSIQQIYFMNQGAAARQAIAVTYAAPAANATINIPTLPGYSAGKTDVTITINSGVYVYATSTANAGLSITGGKAAGDTVTVINNGYIAGQGGNGSNVAPSGGPGGTAFSISSPIVLTNNSYIGGGGGGGGGSTRNAVTGGGGGAGGGNGGAGGPISGSPALVFSVPGGAGGYAGNPGSPAPTVTTPYGPSAQGAGQGGGSGGGSGAYSSKPVGRGNAAIVNGGGGGGSIFPGTGGAGGSAVPGFPFNMPGASGGSGNSAGSPSTIPIFDVSGGGGGWGAAGGTGDLGCPTLCPAPGGAAGKAINLNGNTITYPALGTIWGAIS